jgi:hypothetical protein
MNEEIAQEQQPDEPAVEVVEEQPAATPDPDAELEPELEAQALDVPDGGRYVPVSAVIAARKAAKEAKQAAAEVPTLKQQVAQLQQQTASLTPLAEVARVLLDQRGREQPQPEPAPQDDAEVTEFAKSLDLYDTDGKPDTAKARKVLGIVDARSKQHAQAQVAPFQQQNVQTASHGMLAAALQTTAPDGRKPDPEVVKGVFGRLDPSITATKEGAQWAWAIAFGLSEANGRTVKPQAAAKKLDIPDPLFTEKAGGKDGPATVAMSAADKKLATQLYPNMSEAQAVAKYAKEAAAMPAGWGR